ncbi:Glycerophosphoryl diester phosphodiesterase family-domain-containing protein [Protomyces lactucae-debilis]|uniref:Glycerophosphoryl diester phosphodiesterase family-domain-containing protein n=1 Tax=Protomyces lactucae-debilis TaxID=2754530 RepID=A0A1Y2FR39_PROLT|nr:Glycerophosphoryl diester phosphodiesterase family-domain-containing protein [Protomyces lactucae-debilis]ORY85666.1 Glycerophosphoryl diester phosphodiesterase family-domain-containing protein [Protomyces lactucae-debilis]
MKFGKNLPGNKVPEFAAHYINYKGLKKIIKSSEKDERKETDLTAFLYELDRNLEDINEFFNRRNGDIFRRIGLLRSRYAIKDASDLKRLDMPSEDWEELVAAVIDLRSALQKLLFYAEVNKQGMVKILKKVEKKTGALVRESYLETKVNMLPFASPTATQDQLHEVNRWLSKLVPDGKEVLLAASKTDDSIRRVRSVVHMGLEEERAKAFETIIRNNDSEALKELLDTTVPAISDKVLANLLQQALLAHSFDVARLFLDRMTSLIIQDDINERNVIHKLIIVQGRRICKTKDGQLGGSPLAQEMFITPAIAPSGNLSLGNAALDFGSRTRDDYSEDSPAALKFLLSNMKASMRSTLVHLDAHHRSPLHYVAEYGLEKCAQVVISYMLAWNQLSASDLLEAPRFEDADGYTPIHLCVKHKYPITLGVMLRANNHDNRQTYELRKYQGSTAVNPITLAIGAPNIIRVLLDAGVDVNKQNYEGETAMHAAARLGDVDSIQELLKPNDLQTVNLSLAEKTYGWTPVFVAAVEGHLEAVRILAHARKALDQVDLSGWTAMEHAVFRGHIECGKALVPMSPPGPTSVFEGVRPHMTPRHSSSETRDGLTGKVQPVKSFGHRYLKDKCMIIVTLGSTDSRRVRSPIQLDKVPIAEASSTRLDTALTLVVSAKNAEGDAIFFDLPMSDAPTTEPILFTATDPDKVQLLFDIVPTYSTGGAKLGRAVALLSSIKTKVGSKKASLWGAVTVPIVESESLSVIGTIEFEFSVVTPFSHPQISIEKESTYWKSLMTTRVIGHRGLGKNQPDRKSLQLGENTVQSFVAAANLGASYVEFDVQLTKDLVPVIYHDFLVSQTGIDAPVHSLTLEQFMSTSQAERQTSDSRNRSRVHSPDANEPRTLKERGRSRSLSTQEIFSNIERMKHTRDFKLKGFKGNQRGHSVQDDFSTLEQVFKKVPKNVGFNIECKYPMLSEAEAEEMDNTAIEINQWVDTVLQCVFDHAKGRDIIFSSFHPDICLLLALKQPTMPCLFLTESGTTYMCDVRSSSLQEAIRFASRWNLLGLVSACEPFVLCPRLVRVVKESGLVCVSYGTMNNNPQHVNAQVKAGVDAVIVDSVLAIRKGLTSEEAATNGLGVTAERSGPSTGQLTPESSGTSEPVVA